MKWLENPGKKLIALILGALAWYYVESLSTVKRAYYGTIHYKDMPQGLTEIYMPQRIRYYVSSNNYYHQENSLPELSFEVSLKQAKVGRNYLAIKKKLKNILPPSMRLELARKRVRVILGKKRTKRVAVKASIRNDLSPEYRVQGLKVIPSQITLVGPASQLKSVKEVRLNEIVVGRSGNFAYKKRLKALPGKIKASANLIQVKFQVRANVIEQKLILPIKIKGLPGKWKVKSLRPKKVLFRIKGRFEQVKKFDFKSLFYYIDLERARRAGVYRFELKARKIKGLELFPLKKEKIELELKEAE